MGNGGCLVAMFSVFIISTVVVSDDSPFVFVSAVDSTDVISVLVVAFVVFFCLFFFFFSADIVAVVGPVFAVDFFLLET